MNRYDYEWPVPSHVDALEAMAGAIGDMERGLPPKAEELLVIFAYMNAAGSS
jgi:hypothetical protein